MADSLLKGKRFFCREWAFSKINHCLENRPTAKTCGALIMGGPGCGKTSLCCEVVWPTSNGRQQVLSRCVLAHYFCEAHDIDTLSLTNFIHTLVEQVSKSNLVSGYREHLEKPEVQFALSQAECERHPDEAFKKAILLPLLSITPPQSNLFIIIDSIDESYLQSIDDHLVGSRTIAELVANHHELFPQWLLLVCSARKQSKSVTRLFTGFRKISLDDLRKSHVVRDVQQYILCRLDKEEALRQHLSRETAEMLNQLHIKSNGCFLYLEKVLTGVAENFIMLREIREIPGTLNGLYLWLCQRLFVRKQFSKIHPILNVILAARRPLTEKELFHCAWTRNTTLIYEEFKRRLSVLSKFLIDGKEGTKILFHHSFAEWLLDVKHCTQKYLCTVSEGHAMLAMSLTINAPDLKPIEIQDFALHLSKGNSAKSVLSNDQLALWIIQSGANIEESLLTELPKEQNVMKLLHHAGARLPRSEENLSPNVPLSAVDQEESFTEVLEGETVVNQMDNIGRTVLCNSAYQGNLEMTDALITKGDDLEATDRNGQTPLNLAARQGHFEVATSLLKAGAVVDHPDKDGWTALRSAAWGGHTDVVSLLLEKGAEVDHADSDQRTALRAAAWGGHDDIVINLLKHGAEVNMVDNEGRTALIAAAYMGHTEIVEHLLDHGADIDHEDSDGRTALSVAALCIPASQGHVSVVSLLLERGAAVDHCDHDGMTPLLVAAYEGHQVVCELLLESDADVDHADNNGRTPLQAAASMGHSSVVCLLLFWGAAVDTIDSEGRTVLCIAALQGSVDVVQQLLDRGLDETHRDNAGWTPLHMAAFEGHREVCSQLVECGAKINELDNDGRHALMLAAQEGHLGAVTSLTEHRSTVDLRAHDGKTAFRMAALEGHQEVVQYLIEKGADIDYRDTDGRSTLYILALENHLQVAVTLLENLASVESADCEGRTPLHVAAWQGHDAMVEQLLRHGADVNAVDNDKRTALQSAAWQGHTSIVKLLLQHRADVDHTCNQGATALCIAAQEGHVEVVKVLLSFHANPHHADQYGRTPTRVALKGGHTQVCKLLEDFMASVAASGSNQRQVAGSSPASQTNTPPPSTTTNTAAEKPLSSCAMLPITSATNGQTFKSTLSDSPSSTFDRRKSYLTNNSSKSSSNVTSCNTSSTNQSSSSAQLALDKSQQLSFTQQLEQCSKNINRAGSRVLSPVDEPRGLQPSPAGSPTSEVHSIITGISPEQRLVPNSSKQSTPKKEAVGNSLSLCPESQVCHEEEPVWQRQTDVNTNVAKLEMQRKGSLHDGHSMSGMVMGKTGLGMKSPEMRRKRNGIVTNPNFSKGVNMNGYFNKLSSLPDSMDCIPVLSNGNGHVTAGGMRSKESTYKGPARPTGLPIKKETPL